MTSHTYTPQPVNGISCPLPKNDIQTTPMGLTSIVTQENDNKDILVIPAIKQRISSGNIGSKKAILKKNEPLFRIIEEYLSQLFFPTIQETIR